MVIPFGTVIQHGENVGAIATIQCDDHSKLVGIPIRQCLSDGQWSSESPSCQSKKDNSIKS